MPTSPARLGEYVWGRRWIEGRHLRVLDQTLVRLAARKIRRLLVMMPPRHGKSVLISQFFPAWYLGCHPDHRVLLTSYEAQFAASWGRKARDLLQEFGGPLFGIAIRPDSRATHRWDFANRLGGMITAGVGGPITGRGADLLIVDDPVKNAEQALSETYRANTWDWWVSTAFTRLEPDAVVVIVQTRWHEDDLAGRVVRDQSGESWQTLKFPALAEAFDQLGRQPGEALWPARFPPPSLQAIRAAMPRHWWSALYQQQPSGHESLLWPRSHFEGDDLWFDTWPDDLRLRVVSLDPSKGTGTKHSDYSAFVLLGVRRGGDVYVEADLSNTRPPDVMVEDGIRLLKRFVPHAFTIESNAWQDLLCPMFTAALQAQGLFQIAPRPILNRVNKRLRIEQLDSLISRRQIRFRRTPGTELLVKQLRDFPLGNHDDGPDALEMAVRTAQEMWEGGAAETISLLQPTGKFGT